MKEKIVIGMSGGVDSSAAALILKESGYDVLGLTLRLTPFDSFDAEKDARAVAETIGISHEVLDLRDVFDREVVEYFANEYLSGATPNPCVVCNQKIKFGAMMEAARRMGAKKIATGHYVRTVDTGDRMLLCRSKSGKDQSYFLSHLSQEQLRSALFPLCDMEKEDIREKARQAGLSVADKKDSQEICFIPNDDYVSFLCERRKITPESGDFIDTKGNVIGRHGGVLRYTVGQRKGLGAFGKPMFVTAIDPLNNRVVLGENGEQYSVGMTVEKLNWISFGTPPKSFRAKVKVRFRATPADALIKICGDEATVIFDEPERSVTPGQTAVFCDDDFVIGAGRIKTQIMKGI